VGIMKPEGLGNIVLKNVKNMILFGNLVIEQIM